MDTNFLKYSYSSTVRKKGREKHEKKKFLWMAYLSKKENEMLSCGKSDRNNVRNQNSMQLFGTWLTDKI